MTKRRKAIVLRIREEGRAAALAGKSVFACPYSAAELLDQLQWLRGFYAAGGHAQIGE